MTVTYPWPTDGDPSGDLTVIAHEHTESDITDLGSYAASSHSHLEADITDLNDYLTDAPSDGSEYVRKDGAWAAATGGGGGAVDSVNSQTGDVVLDADDIDDTATLHRFASAAQLSKLDGVEAGATADQTGAEIKAAYEGEANTNAYTDAEKSKLAGIAAGAEVNAVDSVNTQTGAVVLDADDIDDTSTTHKFATAAQLSKIDGVEAGADVTDTANVTAAGALMDSEVTNLAQVKAFDSTDYATAAQGALADSALQAAHHGASSTDHDDRYYTETEIDSQLQAVEGGETRVNTVAASGATEALPAEYAAHKVTMDQNCTFTFTSPTETGAAFALYLSGAFTPTFPASVVWDGGSAPTYASPSLYVFATFDGGTSWVGSLVGSALA